MTFGGTRNAAFASQSNYQSPAAFYNSFRWFLVVMAFRMVVYAICALRINIVLCIVLILFISAFGCLAGAYFSLGLGNRDLGGTLTRIGGAFAFFGSVLVRYLEIGLLFDTVDFPLALPVGDLSGRFLGKEQRRRARDIEMKEGNQVCHRALDLVVT